MRRLVSGLVILLAACSTPTSVDSGLLAVSASSNKVTLSNHTAEPVSYLIATPAYLALYDPGPCRLPEGCNESVAANSTITIPFERIRGYQPGERTAVVVHWRGLAGPPVDSVHRLVIALR